MQARQRAGREFLDFSYDIIDISQPVSSRTACFPGDVPFSASNTTTIAENGIFNLTSFTMSPHVGTHADAPSHIQGDMGESDEMAGAMPLAPFIGPCAVLDVSPWNQAISADMLRSLPELECALPPRLLFRTQEKLRYEAFEEEYAYFGEDAVKLCRDIGIKLLGIDSPSVDHVRSKTLSSHHAMHKHGMFWLENLDLTGVAPGVYFLVAPPLKMLELEAAPLRAILLKPRSGSV